MILPLDAAPNPARSRTRLLNRSRAILPRRWRAWRAPTKQTPRSSRTCCRRSISRCGAVSPAFKNRCSLRTWVYRVAHNVAATYVLRARRRRSNMLVNLDDVEIADEGADVGATIDEARALARVTQLIQRLKPIDREVIILHLEGLSRDEIAEIAGLTFSNVAIKIHRIKQLLTRSFGRGRRSHECRLPKTCNRLWQRQALDAPRISLAYLRHRTGALQRRARIRNAFEYVGGVGAVVWVVVVAAGISSAPRPDVRSRIVLWVAGSGLSDGAVASARRRAGSRRSSSARSTRCSSIASS